MLREMRHFLLSSAILMALSATPLSGQTFGEIAGKITDASGAIVPEATVTAINTATNASRQTVSTVTGDYSFPSLPPGTYNVRVEKPGFKTDERKNVQVSVQQSVRLDFTLAVGQVSETISVEIGRASCRERV